MPRDAQTDERARAELEQRLKQDERRNPSGHGQQSTPHQQREIAESEEHEDDRATATIDPKVLNELK
jgi:hypothetical protein